MSSKREYRRLASQSTPENALEKTTKKLFCDSCACAPGLFVVVPQGTWLLESCYGCGKNKKSRAYELISLPKEAR